jgi:hypothetical protein
MHAYQLQALPLIRITVQAALLRSVMYLVYPTQSNAPLVLELYSSYSACTPYVSKSTATAREHVTNNSKRELCD